MLGVLDLFGILTAINTATRAARRTKSWETMIITHTLEDWMWRLEDGKGWIRYTSKNIKGYTKRDNDVDGVDLYTEYKTGLGPEKSLMDQNHPMSKDIFRSLDFLSE